MTELLIIISLSIDPGQFASYPSSSSLTPTTTPSNNEDNTTSSPFSTQSESSPLPEDPVSPSTTTSPTTEEAPDSPVPTRSFTFSRRSAVIYTNSYRTRKFTGYSTHSAVSRKTSGLHYKHTLLENCNRKLHVMYSQFLLCQISLANLFVILLWNNNRCPLTQ